MSKNHNTFITFVLAASIPFGVITVFFLIKSLIHVGLQYTLDVDELFHINATYQMYIGKLPYRDFLFPYTPFAQWALAPFFVLSDPTASIASARLIAVTAFLLRMGITGAIAMWILGIPFGILATVGILVDPFTAFSGTQFRPDTFAVLFQSLSLLSFLALRKYRSGFFAVMTGVCITLSVFYSLKLLPFAAGLFIAMLFTEKKLISKYGHVVFLSVVLTLAVIVAPFFLSGTINQMLRSVFVDAKVINDTLLYPLHILNFYWPNNWFLYGLSVKAPVWYWELSIPILSVGAIILLFLGTPEESERNSLFAVGIAAILQAGSLLFIRSVFIQYYLPSNWLLIILAAWLMKKVWQKISSMYVNFAALFFLLLMLILADLTNNAVHNYTDRAQTTYRIQLADFSKNWKYIPLDAPVFPGYFFRPNSSYIGYGWNIGDLPKSFQAILNGELTQNASAAFKYIYLSDEQKKYLSAASLQVIENSYYQSVLDPLLLIKK
ncbi:hypothetical protein HY031_00415 [Candidatus Gottesmanbacteria bacterium]|nr:hypothetical protein [Candidatus Gottesmanbacteria bacterium]